MANYESGVDGREFSPQLDAGERHLLGSLVLRVCRVSDGGDTEGGPTESHGERFIGFVGEYNHLKDKCNNLCNQLRMPLSSRSNLSQEIALYRADMANRFDATTSRRMSLLSDLEQTRYAMQKLNGEVMLSVEPLVSGKDSTETAKWLENTSGVLESMTICEGEDGTYVAEFPVTRCESDCRGYWGETTLYTIVFNPRGCVIEAKSKSLD